jgi:septal ring factor EnvC (AmiA/AmiB activator)
MIEINLALIATAIGIVASIWKFANSISKFGHSVDELRKSMQESIDDRRDLRRVLNEHSRTIVKIETQYGDIKEDLDEIKRKVS